MVVDNYTTVSLTKLKKLVKYSSCEVKGILDINMDDFQCADLIILTGGSKYASFERVFDPLKELIRNIYKPIIGICLGYQILGLAYDPDGHYISFKKMGKKLYGCFERDVFVKGNGHWYTMNVFRAHKYILEVTKPGLFDTIGASVRGDDIIKHVDRPHIGISFHPELMSDGLVGDTFFNYIVNKVL